MSRNRELSRSWELNAGHWTRVVREGLIPSRRAGTDAAIAEAVAERAPGRLLDIGCGEGWLVRAMAARTGCAAVGIDGSAALIAAARAADPANRYVVLNYEDFATKPNDVGAEFDIAVFNYALFAAEVVPLLKAAALCLNPGGAIVIQTLHPDAAPADSWQVEDFSAFGGRDWAPMPWYARGLTSWLDVVRAAGLDLLELREPRAADGRILSLLMVAAKSP